MLDDRRESNIFDQRLRTRVVTRRLLLTMYAATSCDLISTRLSIARHAAFTTTASSLANRSVRASRMNSSRAPSPRPCLSSCEVSNGNSTVTMATPERHTVSTSKLLLYKTRCNANGRARAKCQAHTFSLSLSGMSSKKNVAQAGSSSSFAETMLRNLTYCCAAIDAQVALM